MRALSAQSVLVLREGLPFRCWGEKTVVFDVDNGGTFLLDGVGAGVLELLIAEAPLAAGDLEQRLFELVEDPVVDGDAFRVLLRETLNVFASRGWIIGSQGRDDSVRS